jgi:hypothetical protein
MDDVTIVGREGEVRIIRNDPSGAYVAVSCRDDYGNEHQGRCWLDAAGIEQAIAALAAPDGTGTVRARREDLETIIGWHDGWDLATTEENAAVRRMQAALAAAGEAGAGEGGAHG